MNVKILAAATKTSADGLTKNSQTEASVGQRAKGEIPIQREANIPQWYSRKFTIVLVCP